jgi:hypothetical protein
MNLDQMLTDALHDERLALPVPSDTLSLVRRRRRRRQARLVAGTAAASVTLVGAAVGTVSLLSSPASSLSPYSSGGPVPGISPAFAPTSGRDWILSPDAWRTFRATHTEPSPPPGQSTVASPAPLAQMSADLLADVRAAGLPAGTQSLREDAVGGQPGTAAVHVTMSGGVPVEVFRTTLVEPTSTEQNGPGTNTDATVVDVPGTTDAAALFPTYGYGFPGRDGNAHQVMVVTSEGLMTSWVAPESVPLDTLRAWAFAAARH